MSLLTPQQAADRMNHEERANFLARHLLYGAIEHLATQAEISKENATILLAGYGVELVAVFRGDGAFVRELCECAAMDGLNARRKLAIEREKNSGT